MADKTQARTHHGVARTTLVSLGIKAAQIALQFALVALLARLLTPDAYGHYAFMFAVAMAVTAPAGAAGATVATRYTTVYRARVEWHLAHSLWRALARWSIAYGTVAAAVFGIWAAVATGPDARLTPVMAVCLAVFVLSFPLLRATDGILRGLHHTILGQLPETVVRPAAQLAFLLLLVTIGTSDLDPTAALATLAMATVLATALTVVLRRRLQPLDAAADRDQPDRGRWLRSLLPVSITGGLLLLSQQIDTIMLGMLASDAETGLYRVAAQASLLVAVVLQAATPVFAPYTADAHTKGHHGLLQRQIGRATGAIFLISLVPAMLLLGFGDQVLAGVFGPAYAAGHTSLAILALAQLANVACGFTGLLLEMTGRERDASIGVAVGVAVNLLLNLLLIPAFGMTGAAIATASGLVVWNLLLGLAIYRHLGINVTAFNPAAWRAGRDCPSPR